MISNKCMLLALHNHNNRRVEINSYRINPIRREVDYQLFPLSSMHLSGRDPDERDQYPEDVQHIREQARDRSPATVDAVVGLKKVQLSTIAPCMQAACNSLWLGKRSVPARLAQASPRRATCQNAGRSTRPRSLRHRSTYAMLS